MPHLEFQTYAGQLFWLAISFVLLYVILWRAVLPRISSVLETRGEVIASDLQKAEKAKNDAEAAQLKLEKLLAETGDKARKLIDESSAKAKAGIEKKRADMQAKLDEKLEKAEKEISKIEKDSISKIDDVSKDLAKLIVSKLTKEAA